MKKGIIISLTLILKVGYSTLEFQEKSGQIINNLMQHV